MSKYVPKWANKKAPFHLKKTKAEAIKWVLNSPGLYCTCTIFARHYTCRVPKVLQPAGEQRASERARYLHFRGGQAPTRSLSNAGRRRRRRCKRARTSDADDTQGVKSCNEQLVRWQLGGRKKLQRSRRRPPFSLCTYSKVGDSPCQQSNGVSLVLCVLAGAR
jgi:hypothetical protein